MIQKFIRNGNEDWSIIHDAICNTIVYDYQSKKITISLNKEAGENEKFIIIFENVFAFHMISCDYWGESPHLYGMTVVDVSASEIAKKIKEDIRSNGYIMSRFDNDTEGIEVQIQYISGDIFQILCQNASVICD